MYYVDSLDQPRYKDKMTAIHAVIQGRKDDEQHQKEWAEREARWDEDLKKRGWPR